jgi:hypothetical protein
MEHDNDPLPEKHNKRQRPESDSPITTSATIIPHEEALLFPVTAPLNFDKLQDTHTLVFLKKSELSGFNNTMHSQLNIHTQMAEIKTSMQLIAAKFQNFSDSASLSNSHELQSFLTSIHSSIQDIQKVLTQQVPTSSSTTDKTTSQEIDSLSSQFLNIHTTLKTELQDLVNKQNPEAINKNTEDSDQFEKYKQLRSEFTHWYVPSQFCQAKIEFPERHEPYFNLQYRFNPSVKDPKTKRSILQQVEEFKHKINNQITKEILTTQIHKTKEIHNIILLTRDQYSEPIGNFLVAKAYRTVFKSHIDLRDRPNNRRPDNRNNRQEDTTGRRDDNHRTQENHNNQRTYQNNDNTNYQRTYQHNDNYYQQRNYQQNRNYHNQRNYQNNDYNNQPYNRPQQSYNDRYDDRRPPYQDRPRFYQRRQDEGTYNNEDRQINSHTGRQRSYQNQEGSNQRSNYDRHFPSFDGGNQQVQTDDVFHPNTDRYSQTYTNTNYHNPRQSFDNYPPRFTDYGRRY